MHLIVYTKSWHEGHRVWKHFWAKGQHIWEFWSPNEYVGQHIHDEATRELRKLELPDGPGLTINNLLAAKQMLEQYKGDTVEKTLSERVKDLEKELALAKSDAGMAHHWRDGWGREQNKTAKLEQEIKTLERENSKLVDTLSLVANPPILVRSQPKVKKIVVAGAGGVNSTVSPAGGAKITVEYTDGTALVIQ